MPLLTTLFTAQGTQFLPTFTDSDSREEIIGRELQYIKPHYQSKGWTLESSKPSDLNAYV